jgi:hypothetical protein
MCLCARKFGPELYGHTGFKFSDCETRWSSPTSHTAAEVKECVGNGDLSPSSDSHKIYLLLLSSLHRPSRIPLSRAGEVKAGYLIGTGYDRNACCCIALR